MLRSEKITNNTKAVQAPPISNGMKLFLIGFGHMRRDQIEVARMLQKNHTIQYWVRMNSHFTIDETEFPKTVFHEYTDAIRGISPRGIDAFAFEPWSSKDIAEYAETESECMTMADKLYPDWSVNRRKDMYYDMLRYWRGVLGEYKPDCIIFLGVPHEISTFVLYRIAKFQGTRTIILENTLGIGHYAVFEDYTVGSEDLIVDDKEQGRATTVNDLSAEMRAFYERVSKGEDPVPAYVQKYRDTYAKRNLRRWKDVVGRFIRDGTIFERAVMKIFKMMKPSLKDEHRANERPVDFKKPYVYFPLHYQPEATTSPLGGIYVDQILAIQTLAAALPEGWELYVKDHGVQLVVHHANFTPARYPGFYARIASTPRVRLIPITTNTFKLIDSAKTTATIAGTAAWESLLRGKAALIFGYPWYMHAPGIFRVAGVEDCRRAFAKIMQGFAPRESDILGFLQRVDRTSLHGDVVRPTPHAEMETYAKEMYEAIQHKLTAA